MLSNKIELLITSRERDLGGFTVRRILPYASHRMVGPFIFFDHMGPAEFAPGKGMSVRPHPHINLATVTYLFEGIIHHRDSLGSNQLIEPGAVNWMTAGRGIVHSERTPEAQLAKGGRMNGIQLWVALPESAEEIEPSFSHHPKDTLPEFNYEGAKAKLLLGSALGHSSPVPINSNLFYLEMRIPRGTKLVVPAEKLDMAIYLVEGQIEIDGTEVDPCVMAVMKSGQDAPIHAKQDSRMMILGGEPLGPRNIFWNFVSSSKERIEEAKRQWMNGPTHGNERFPPIPGDDQEFIPLPEEPGNPRGTIM